MVVIWFLTMMFISCGGSKTSTPSNNNTPNPNPLSPSPGGSNPSPSALCGPYNANATSSTGAAPPYPANIIDMVGQNNAKSINMCVTVDSTSAIDSAVTYVQISSDTLFIWSDSARSISQTSSFTASDTAADHDHFEFLGSALTSGGSGGNSDTIYIPRILSSGYQLSKADLSQFIFSYTNPIYLSNTQSGNKVGNFLGKSGFLAFRVYTAQNYLYGWANVQLTSTYQLSLYEVVLSTNINTPLVIGQYQ
jgi:hypothetical protein